MMQWMRITTTPPGSASGEPIPTSTTHGWQLYSLAEKAGGCPWAVQNTLAFLTNDVHALETAFQQCTGVLDTLASAATTTADATIPPAFHAISKAGVEDFKSTTKTLHRAGSKRKHRKTPERCINV